MKLKLYDYSGLGVSTLLTDKYRHVLLWLGWVGYLIMFVITERMIPVSRCHVVHSVVDDWILFNEFFIVPYVYWYVLLAGSLLFFFLFDVKSFKNAQAFIITTQVLAIIIYIAWPSVQFLRPEYFERNNVCTFIIGHLYAIDTPTGVCPSMHVAFAAGVMSAWLKREETSVFKKILIVISVFLIVLSVMFIKQHSFVDVVAAIPVCLVAELVEYLAMKNGPDAHVYNNLDTK